MRRRFASAMFLIPIMLAACATTGVNRQHTNVELTGVIAAADLTPAIAGSSGIYRPGMGGAVGGLVFALLPKPGERPAFMWYVVKANPPGERVVRVAFREAFEVGSCVDVLVEKVTGYAAFFLDDASLRLSTACTH